jgi:phosphate transport system substrate-binding protein
MPSSEAVLTYVSRNPAAIAYLSRAYVREQLEDPSGQPSELAPLAVKVLSLEGQLPTVESLAKQQYPLIQPLYLITAGPPAARERLFIDFVLSPAGQAIVAQYHAPIR